MAFTWICTLACKFIILYVGSFANRYRLRAVLAYFTMLFVLSILHHRNDSRIWQYNIHNFPSLYPAPLPSASATPILPRFCRKPPTVFSPKPRRPDVVPAALYSYRSGLGSQYEIEHYRPPSGPTERPVPPIPAATPRQQPRTTTQAGLLPSVTLYPQYMQSVSQSWQSPQPPPQSYSPPSPPPLGNWPNVSAPARTTRGQPITVTPATADTAVVQEISSLPRARPSGPRTRSNSSGHNRPPPLDLSKISAFKGKGLP